MLKFRFKRKHLSIPYFIFLVLFVLLPLLLIIYYALSNENGTISLENFAKFFSNKNKIGLLSISIIIGADGTVYDLYDADVKVSVGLKSIEIIDNDEDGTVSGEIVSIIYKGDHYQVIIRTDEDEDFVVDTEYTWNEFDKVSVKIKPENIHMKLVKEAKNYVKI